MESSLVQMLIKHDAKKHISFSMPGHKNGKGIKGPLAGNFFQYDVTELEDTDSIHSPGTALRQALSGTANFFGADESFILVNGSSSGIFTMLMSCCNRGDTIAVNRCCHVSVINACTVLGLRPVFISQPIINKLGIADTVSVNDTETVLKKEKISAVLITSPTYYGFTANIHAISKITDKLGIPLLVDEAHGAHFAANKSIFPPSAMLSGADMCVQSAHKTLNSANQTAYLHLKGKKIDREKVKNVFSFFQTTSPCYPLMAIADAARCEAETNGANMWKEVHKRCFELRKKKYFISPDKTWVGKYNFSDIDECRLVFGTGHLNGFEIAKKLSYNFRIDVEMADLNNIVLIPTPSNTDHDFEILDNALHLISQESSNESKTFFLSPPAAEIVTSPSEAFELSGIFIDIKNTCGRISKNTVTPYPPGIPALMPGEKINADMIEYLSVLKSSGVEIHGVKDGKIEVVK